MPRVLAVLVSASLLASTSMAESDPEAIEILDRVDTLYQQDSAHSVISMSIVTPDYERSMKLESWALGLDYSLVRVLEPRKERGVSTLKRDDEMWNYFPKIRKQVKVPPSMMMNSWMGSDFTNDDLMRETSWTEDYTVTLEEDGEHYVLDLNPKEATVTVWGGMTVTVRQSDLLPVSQRYYDEDGTLMRIMRFSDIQTFDGVKLPATMTLEPQNKEGHRTTVTYESMEFDVGLEPDFFSLQNLRKRR